MTDCAVELLWMPVGAGTRLQQQTLRMYSWVLALVRWQRPEIFVHAALKVRLGERRLTLELTPVPKAQHAAPLVTGAVGSKLAARLHVFRYQLVLLDADEVPDERWCLLRTTLGEDCRLAERTLEIARTVPNHTWGRRVRGTTEMWTSDSSIAWLLSRAGVDAASLPLPPGTQAPGWRAGLELAGAEARDEAGRR